MPFYMYVSISEEDRISVYEMDPGTGSLEALHQVPAPGRPGPMCVGPERRFLYVGRRGDNEISSYAIDRASGGLSLLGTAPLESDPCYISTDRNGRFLLSAYYGAGAVTVHPIGEDGTVGDRPAESLGTAQGAHCVQTDPTNRFAFLPHIAGDVGPNEIWQFKFDERTGRLTPNSPPKLIPDDGVGPRHYCFHPSKDVVYFSNEQGCSVTAYHLDAALGTLSAFQTVSTLPDGFDGQNSCAQIQISPDGRSLYAPNRGHNSIACFNIDESTGALIRTGIVPTEPVPRAFTIDPQGRYLYATGLESGRLAAYRIGNNGDLKLLDTYELGKAPMWVLIVEV